MTAEIAGTDNTAALLRQAAGKLREHVAQMPEPWRTLPWRQVQSDTESMDGIAACANSHEYDEEFSDECCTTSGADGLGHETVAAYVETVHPPVALALAAWLGAEAQEVEHGWRRSTTAPATALAKAVMRANEATVRPDEAKPAAPESYGHVVLIPDAVGRLQPNWDGELHTDRAAAAEEVERATATGEQAVLAEVVADRG